MQLRLELLDFEKDGEYYRYTYGICGTSFVFFKKYYKSTFYSKLPHWWWSEIQKQMIKQKLFFEDLLKKSEEDLGMGTISCSTFTLEDREKYGTNIYVWTRLRDQAIEKKIDLTKKYNKKYGDPDLTAYSLFSN